MPAYETEEFTWGLSTSHYYLDKGATQMVTLERENWMKDAQGNVVANWFGAGNVWGLGGGPMGGEPRKSRLPKTIRISYYDYQEDRFFQLDAELPQKKIFELFKQRTVDRSRQVGDAIPRYDRFLIGIAPQGHVVLWVRAAGAKDQVELATYKAQVLQGMTIDRYNGTGTYGPNEGRAFPISTDRWGKLSSTTSLKPATVEKLKSGWLPPVDYYLQQRIKYPWRYQMSGNGRLLEFTETQGNQEHFYVGPWSLAPYLSDAAMRGVPETSTMWFSDSQGKRHSIYLAFFDKERVAGEPDLTPIWQAFRSVFPDRKVEDNDYWPGARDMATVNIHVSDDLKTYAATLIKNELRIPLPVGKAQLFDLEPFADWLGQDTPAPDVIKRLQGGPDVANH